MVKFEVLRTSPFQGSNSTAPLNRPHRRGRRVKVLSGYLALVAFGGFMLVQRTVAESTSPSMVHFRSPRGFSIVVPVYVNDSGPFEFLMDTGSTLTIVDQELMQSLKLDLIGDGISTSLTGKTTMPLAIARTIAFGPMTQHQVELGVQDLSGLRKMDSKIRGVLGQNVLTNADYLIDNLKRTIEFDSAGSLLASLDGERIVTSRFPSPDNPLYGGTSVPVRLGGPGSNYCLLLLDTGSASVILFSDSPDVARLPKQSSAQVMEDDEGRKKYVAAYPMELHAGKTYQNVQVYVADIGSRGLGVEGLLPTADFRSIYINNSEGFVIFQPKRNRHAIPGDPAVANCTPDRHDVHDACIVQAQKIAK